MRPHFAFRGLPAALALHFLAIGAGPARAQQQDADLQRHLRALEKAKDYMSSGRIADSIAALGDRAVPGLETLLKLLDHKQGAVRSGAMTALERAV
jgi:hypothetical protein